MNMKAVIKDLQDTLTILDEAERQQSKVLPDHGERLVIEEQISECRRESPAGGSANVDTIRALYQPSV
jgi:hypothetical protein